MTIIVTGGAGFIGSNFIFHMLNKYPDYRIICLDCLTYAGNLSTLEPVMSNPNFRFVKESITDREAVYKLFEEEHPDMVVNFAAESHVDRSIENPEVFLTTNILGTQVLMDACRKYGIKRYHQVSTDEVYGDLPLDRPDLFFTEETPIHTSSPYSSSKAGADLLVLAYHRTYGLPVTISRCSNNYGPYQFPEKLIPLIINNALHGKKLPVYGDGKNVRDWLYVDDHAKAIDMVQENGRLGETYNVGGHNEKQNIEIINIIIDTLLEMLPADDPRRALVSKDLITYVEDRKGHDRRYAIDPTKLGQKAIDCMPCIMQGFVKRPKNVEKGLPFDRKLYVARRVFEQSNDDTYVVSLSSRTIVYKGMFLVEQLRLFFADLQDKDYESAIATVHSLPFLYEHKPKLGESTSKPFYRT